MPTTALGSTIPKDEMWTLPTLPTVLCLLSAQMLEPSVNCLPARRWVWPSGWGVAKQREGPRKSRPGAATLLKGGHDQAVAGPKVQADTAQVPLRP